MRSPPYQHTRPTYQHNHLVLPVLPPNQRSQSLSRSRKITKQFKKSNQNTNGGAPRFKQALSVPTQNRNTSRQDFQFSLLPATSVARGKKLVKTLREWKHEKLFLITVYQEVTLSTSMSDQSKITAAELPRSSPARSLTNRFSLPIWLLPPRMPPLYLLSLHILEINRFQLPKSCSVLFKVPPRSLPRLSNSTNSNMAALFPWRTANTLLPMNSGPTSLISHLTTS
jgi:hypothetical protein